MRRWSFWWIKYFKLSVMCSCWPNTPPPIIDGAAPSLHSENSKKRSWDTQVSIAAEGGSVYFGVWWGSIFLCFVWILVTFALVFNSMVSIHLVTRFITFKKSQLLAHLPHSNFFYKRKNRSLCSVWHMETLAYPWSSLTLLCISPDRWLMLLSSLELVQDRSWACR